MNDVTSVLERDVNLTTVQPVESLHSLRNRSRLMLHMRFRCGRCEVSDQGLSLSPPISCFTNFGDCRYRCVCIFGHSCVQTCYDNKAKACVQLHWVVEGVRATISAIGESSDIEMLQQRQLSIS
jgi:hypothetical protein